MNSRSTWNNFDNRLLLFCVREAFLRANKNVSAEELQNHARDAEWLRLIGGGDRAAFAEFYDNYSTLLYSIAVKVLNDSKEAEDVLQEVFVQIWEKADFDSRLGKASSWAITMVRNKSIDRIRALQRRSRLVEEAVTSGALDASPAPTANDSVHGREKAALVRSAMAELPQEQRHAIEMAFFSGLTQNEISDSLREPLGTIKARIRRGMLKLRDKLEGCL